MCFYAKYHDDIKEDLDQPRSEPYTPWVELWNAVSQSFHQATCKE